MSFDQDLLSRLYDAFNARDIETLLASLDEHVEWPNAMNGGQIHGRENLRAYWTWQWTVIDPRVEVIGFTAARDGATVVDVRQIVHKLNGTFLLEQRVRHMYHFVNGLVSRMDILSVEDHETPPL
jgi:hypothetical protein